MRNRAALVVMTGFMMLLCGCEQDVFTRVDTGFESPDGGSEPSIASDGGVPAVDAGADCVEGTLSLPALFDRPIRFTDPNLSNLFLGAGYHTRRGELRRACVVGSTTATAIDEVMFEFQQIELSEARREELGVSAEIGVGFTGGAVSNKFSLALERNISSSELALVARVTVVKRSEGFRDNIELHPEVASLPFEDPIRFLELCGDRFVNEIVYGATLTVIITVKTKDEADRRSLTNTLSASFGVFGGSSEVSDSVSTALQSREINWYVARRGGGLVAGLPDPSADNVAELFGQYLANFPQEVDAAADAVSSYVVVPYNRLALDICMPEFNRAAAEAIGRAWTSLNEMADLRLILREAANQPVRFICIDDSDVQALRAQADQLAQLQEAIQAAVTGCAAELTDDPAPTCEELERLLEQATMFMRTTPARWTYFERNVADMDNETPRSRYAWPTPTNHCGPAQVTGRWSRWESDDRCPDGRECFEACPMAIQTVNEVSITIPDDRVSDNRGQCIVEFGCVDPGEVHLLDCTE